jgi:hypothetical protein
VQRWVVQKTSSFWLFRGMLLTPKTEAARVLWQAEAAQHSQQTIGSS